jgi:ABC-type multidrug transport system fused ATPase/permease subunit
MGSQLAASAADALGYEDLAAGVTLMEQDSQLLSGTVAENLR